MKKIFLFLTIIIFFFSCKKESIYTNNTELWVKIDNSIESLDIYFTGINTRNKQRSYVVNYTQNGIFSSAIKQVKEGKDGKAWVLIHVSLEKSDEILITYNNKEYKNRGFYLGERRFMEIILTLNGDVNVNDYDISTIDKIIYVN